MTAVSVVVPTYNNAAHVGATLESILDQTFPDFELVISDNHSTDKTAAICLERAARDLVGRMGGHRADALSETIRARVAGGEVAVDPALRTVVESGDGYLPLGQQPTAPRAMTHRVSARASASAVASVQFGFDARGVWGALAPPTRRRFTTLVGASSFASRPNMPMPSISSRRNFSVRASARATHAPTVSGVAISETSRAAS